MHQQETIDTTVSLSVTWGNQSINLQQSASRLTIIHHKIYSIVNEVDSSVMKKLSLKIYFISKYLFLYIDLENYFVLID